MADFRMPSLGADMDAGTLLTWRIKPGDRIKRGDIVAEVDTDKAVIDVETFVGGVVGELLVDEGTRVPVGTPLARIRDDSEVEARTTPAKRPAKRTKAGPRHPAAHPAAPWQPAPLPAEEPVPSGSSGWPAAAATPGRSADRHWASPLARHRARELGLDLARLTGTGRDGIITAEDVAQAADRRTHLLAEPPVVAAPTAPSPPREALSGADRREAMRRAIGALMTRSKREIPHYYVSTDIDMSRAQTWLEEANTQRPVTQRLLPAVLLLKASALALRDSPVLNGFWTESGFQAADGVHLGVAVALRGGGLVAPAIHDADRATLPELMSALRDLVDRARSGRLRSSEMSDPTITVTNLGDQGVDSVLPVIYPPQVAIIGFGRITERPWAAEGMIGARPIVTATLAADHRASDGHQGAQFLTALDRLLQSPEEL